MFEKASRLKLRFDSKKGSITTEDLWDLNLTSLDVIAKSLNAKMKLSEEESFIAVKTVANKKLELAFEVIKHVIKIKLEEKDKSKKAVEIAARKEQILAIISSKKTEELASKSVAELQKEYEGLGKD